MQSDYEELLAKAAQHLTTSAWKPKFILTKARGSTIWLNDQPYLDFATGPGVSNVGHNHPEILEAIRRVYDNDEAGWGGNMLLNQYQIKLAEKLCEITPGKFSKRVFFSNSGGEAVEAAIFACLKNRPERRGMVSFIGDFHGRLGFCRSATTSKPLHVEGLNWGVERVFFLIFPAENPETLMKQEFLDNFRSERQYLNYVENTIGPFIKEINFALFELVQGEGGINFAKQEMIRALFQYLKDNGVRTIVDEVQSGLGRTGKMWASEIYNVEPDILTVAKALSGGVIPIGATILREELDYKKTGEHCNTFGAFPQACAAGLKSLEIIEKENLVQKSHQDGLRLRGKINSAIAESNVSGRGLMSRMTFQSAASRDRVVVGALERGLFLMSAGERSVRLMPPLMITTVEMEKAVGILMESIKNAY